MKANVVALIATFLIVLAAFPVHSFFWFDSQCNYRCMSGTVVQNTYYHRVSSGCSTYRLSYELVIQGISFNQCCYRHSSCYSSCNSGRSNCDNSLYDCAMNECSRCTNRVTYLACRSYARMIFQTTTVSGCSSYKTEQQMACRCG